MTWVTFNVGKFLIIFINMSNYYSSRAPEFTPGFFFGVVSVAHLCSCVCPIMFLYVLGFVLWCQLRFPHKNDVRSVFTSRCSYEASCLIYIICVCLCIMMFNKYCVVFLFYLSSSCTLCYQFLWIVLLSVPSVFLFSNA
jgi:hypothetical protein